MSRSLRPRARGRRAPAGRDLPRSSQRIADLTQAGARQSGARAEAIKARLREQVARLLETGAGFDPDRLHQEAVMLATRADIQEELDRLLSHVEARSELLASREPSAASSTSWRRSSTARPIRCAPRPSTAALTAIGLDLKTVIDQMREQVQNIE